MDNASERGKRMTRRGSRRTLFASLAGLIAIAAVALVVLRLVGSDVDNRLAGTGEQPYSLTYPDTWRPFTADELAALPEPPLAVIVRKQGEAIIIVQRRKAFAANLSKFTTDLRQELDRRIPDFREVSARLVRVEAGNAYSYSYIRIRRGSVHTIVVVPAGPAQSYVLTTVLQGGADEAAAESGEIIRSFDVEKP